VPKLPLLSDIRNIELTLASDGPDLTQGELENVMQMMARPEFPGYSLEGVFDDTEVDHVEEKKLSTNGEFILTVQTKEMLDRFKKFPLTLCADATFSTNRCKYMVLSLLVVNQRGEAMPIIQGVGRTENSRVFSIMLQILKSRAPEAIKKTLYLVTDCARAYINGFRSEIGPIFWVQCGWHVFNAWDRQIKDPELLAALKQAALMPSRAEFEQEMSRLEGVYKGSKGWNYFQSCYGDRGKVGTPVSWARWSTRGLLTHNLSTERHHREMKKHVFPGMRVDSCLHGLLELNQFFAWKESCIELGIRGFRPSTLEWGFTAAHPKGSSDWRIFDASNNGYILQSGSLVVMMEENRRVCCRELCMVKCKRCNSPLCIHVYVCNCRDYCYQNYCSHLHILALKLKATEQAQEAEPQVVEPQEDTLEPRFEDTEMIVGEEVQNGPQEVAVITSVNENISELTGSAKWRFICNKFDNLKAFFQSSASDSRKEKFFASGLQPVVKAEIPASNEFTKQTNKRIHEKMSKTKFPK
jgi:hypothetical protein